MDNSEKKKKRISVDAWIGSVVIPEYLDTKDWFGSVGYIVKLYKFSFFSILNGIFSDKNSIIMLSSKVFFCM